MASLYCDHDRLADACEHCLAQAAGLKDAFDGPSKVLRAQAVDSNSIVDRLNGTTSRVEAAPKKATRKRSTRAK
jgi:hypothetical protein